MRPLLVLVAHGLWQLLRDRAVVLMALVIPASLSLVFALASAQVHSPTLPPVSAALAMPQDDASADILRDVLADLADDGVPLTVLRATADEARSALEAGDVDVAIVVPEGFDTAVADGNGPTVEVVLGDRSGTSGDVVAGVVAGVVARLDARASLVRTASDSGLGPAELGRLGTDLGSEAAASDWPVATVVRQQLPLVDGIIAGVAGMFLVFTVGLGVVSLQTEREIGTLTRLQSMPLRPWQVPAAKLIVSVLLGTGSTLAVLFFATVLIDQVAFGSWPAVAGVVLAAAVAIASLMAVVVRVSRSTDQANQALAILSVSLGVASGTFIRLPSTPASELLLANPLAALGRGLALTSQGADAAALTPVLVVLAVFAAASGLVAAVLPRRGAGS